MVNFYREIYKSVVSSTTRTLKDTLFPKQCLNCHAWGRYFCDKCCGLLTPVDSLRCIVCQKTNANGQTHSLCRTAATPDGLVSIFDYHNELVSKAINTAKLALVAELFVELTAIGAKILGAKSPQDFVLCPIPLSISKKRFRGFNQSEVITKIFALHFGLPVDPLLTKPRATKQQKLLNKEQRQTNLQNSFQISIPQSLPNKVLLIDDITTTGSTFTEASKVLKEAGVKTVWCLALAQD